MNLLKNDYSTEDNGGQGKNGEYTELKINIKGSSIYLSIICGLFLPCDTVKVTADFGGKSHENPFSPVAFCVSFSVICAELRVFNYSRQTCGRHVLKGFSIALLYLPSYNGANWCLNLGTAR